MSQIKTHKVTHNSVMRDKLFRVGVKEVRQKKPINPELIPDNEKQDIWNYERGRMFAILHPEISVDDLKPAYGKVSSHLQRLFIKDMARGDIL